MPEGLELVPTEDLLTELAGRYDSIVFAGLRDLSKQHQESDCMFAGGQIVAKGLACELQDYLRTHASQTPDPDDFRDFEGF